MTNEKTSATRRAKGEGSIFKNKKGRWVARYKKEGLPAKEFTGKTKSEVSAKLEEYKFLYLSGSIVNHKVSFEEYSVKFLNYKNSQVKRQTLKQSTYDRIEATYNNQIRDTPICKVLMCNLTSKDLQEHIDSLQDDYSFSTIKKCYEFFTALITYGIDEGDFPKTYNPMRTVELPNERAVGVKTKTIEILSNDAIEAFKEKALSRKSDGSLIYQYGPAFVFALNTGLREGELLTISKNAIYTDKYNHPHIHITETVSWVKNRNPKVKNKYVAIITPPKYPRSVRDVPLNQEALYCLKLMEQHYTGVNPTRNDFIITTSTGSIPTRSHFQDAFNRILKACNLPHYGIHSLRHTFCTKMLEKTNSLRDIKTVAAIMGDDYKVIIKTYLHQDDENKYNLISSL